MFLVLSAPCGCDRIFSAVPNGGGKSFEIGVTVEWIPYQMWLHDDLYIDLKLELHPS